MHVYLEEHLKGAKTDRQIKQALAKTFDKIEHEWEDLVKLAFHAGYPQTAYLGSTALVAIVRENKLYVANSGHSKAALLRKTYYEDGDSEYIPTFQLMGVSETHSIKNPYQSKVFNSQFASVKAAVKNNKIAGAHVATRCLGNMWMKRREFH